MAGLWLNKIKWDNQGLVPVVVQEHDSNVVLMFAWMNRAALMKTIETNEAHYWSRSRKKLWRKGESSGHTQKVHEVRLDCDADVLLLNVEQVGGIACHTGRHHCFFHQLKTDAHDPKKNTWAEVEPIRKNPEEIYGKS